LRIEKRESPHPTSPTRGGTEKVIKSPPVGDLGG